MLEVMRLLTKGELGVVQGSPARATDNPLTAANAHHNAVVLCCFRQGLGLC